MTQILQRTLNTGVAPARILGRHLHDQAPNFRKDAGASRPALGVRPFSNDQLPVPPKNGVGCDNRRDLRQNPTTKTRAEAARRRRSSSVNRRRWLRRCAFRIRFSSRRYAMTSCCSRWRQPMRDATNSYSGITRRVYVNCRPSFRTVRHHRSKAIRRWRKPPWIRTYRVSGRDRSRWLQRVLTNDVAYDMRSDPSRSR
jgi:hypothetical protein